MPRDYIPKIPKTELKDGLYYEGRCRNASVARWDAEAGVFVHYRTKFNQTYVEEIHCPEDEQHFDVFVTEREISPPAREIPLRNNRLING